MYSYNTEKDEEGKILLKDVLERYGYKDVKLSPGQFDCYDETAIDKEGKICYFEIKKRTAPHNNPFGDTIIEKKKFQNLKKLQNDNSKVFVVNIFTDYILTIIPLDAPHSEQTVYAQRTNNWDRDKVKKIFISYPNEKEYQYRYHPNIINGL